VRFPNESDAYRAARTQLLAEEIELRRHIERVAELRRALPPGGEVTKNYRFESENGSVSFADLFGDKQSLAVYSFMFGRSASAPARCAPICSAPWRVTPPTSCSAWRSPSSPARRSSG
jgi:predicted dithiol-disulfide oxidoreductase (DUF899 family)